MTMDIITQILKDFDKQFPCIQTGCDGNGIIAYKVEDEWEPQRQCQYCYQVRFPFKDFIRSCIRQTAESVPLEKSIREDTFSMKGYNLHCEEVRAWQDKILEDTK